MSRIQRVEEEEEEEEGCIGEGEISKQSIRLAMIFSCRAVPIFSFAEA